MKTFLSDCKRAIISWRFLLAVLGTFSVYLADAWVDLQWGTSDLLYYFSYANQMGAYNDMLVLLCVLPYAVSYAQEWNSNMTLYAAVRSGKTTYALSKAITTAISGGLALAAGLALFLGILSFRFPLVNTDKDIFIIMSHYSFGSLLQSGHYVLYYIFFIIQTFAYGAFWSMVALLVSAYIPNLFVTVSSPFLCYYFLDVLFRKMHMPSYLDITSIHRGVYRFPASPYLTLLFVLWYFLGLTAVLAFFFVRKFKRSLHNA